MKWWIPYYTIIINIYVLFFARPKIRSIILQRTKRKDDPRKALPLVRCMFFGNCKTHGHSARSNILQFLSEKPLLTQGFSMGNWHLLSKKSKICQSLVSNIRSCNKQSYSIVIASRWNLRSNLKFFHINQPIPYLYY